MKHIIAWFSGGATSAAACKLALEQYPEQCEIVYIETGSHHPDHVRFIADCECWYGQRIVTIRSDKYANHLDVIEKTRYINGPTGARCTTELKKKVREKFEKANPQFDTQVWGFEFSKKEENRAKRHREKHPETWHIFPLIEAQITKEMAFSAILRMGITLPAMYLLGYSNSNCIGCPKGGMAYWNKIRGDFPPLFKRMAELERSIGRSCLRSTFLDGLAPDAGRGQAPLIADCGAVGEGCEIDLAREYSTRE
jgi:3'-phosphoadenosine 5'-phosphosulfate sulfotransferase (PAPS reductase)/FAD synthetase